MQYAKRGHAQIHLWPDISQQNDGSLKAENKTTCPLHQLAGRGEDADAGEPIAPRLLGTEGQNEPLAKQTSIPAEVCFGLKRCRVGT
jgi:hypothetical protein